MGPKREHWETVYTTKSSTDVSWYQALPDVSLAMIRAAHVGTDAAIVDVGGGASTLVDHLLAEGYRRPTVLDISAAALEVSRRRLGDASSRVDWIVADITAWRPPRRFDLWHDRAVFHFLISEDDRRGYRNALEAGVGVGGTVIIATFAQDGPERCSGLPVCRYSPETLGEALGPGFSLRDTRSDDHATPAGHTQRFVTCRFVRTS